MRPLILKIHPAVFITGVLVFIACSHVTNPGEVPSAPPTPSVAGDQYAQEIVELNQVIQHNPTPDKTKRAHLKLARLYSNHKNPRRNYQKALSHLKVYASLENLAVNDEMRNWMAVLKEIDRLKKEITTQNERIQQLQSQLDESKTAKLALKTTNRKLTSEEIKLREKNRKLQESNQKLQKTIEMLKNLDQRLEEKRRNFNN